MDIYIPKSLMTDEYKNYSAEAKNCILTEQHIRSGKQQNPNRALII